MLSILQFFGAKNPSFDTFIGPDMKIVGAMTFTGDVRIEGQMVGNVMTYKSTSGTVVVGKTGHIQGDVVVSNAVVSGSIHGSVIATAVVGVASTGHIDGDVTYDRLTVHEKAHIQGRHSRGSCVPLTAPRPVDDAEFDDEELNRPRVRRA